MWGSLTPHGVQIASAPALGLPCTHQPVGSVQFQTASVLAWRVFFWISELKPSQALHKAYLVDLIPSLIDHSNNNPIASRNMPRTRATLTVALLSVNCASKHIGCSGRAVSIAFMFLLARSRMNPSLPAVVRTPHFGLERAYLNAAVAHDNAHCIDSENCSTLKFFKKLHNGRNFEDTGDHGNLPFLHHFFHFCPPWRASWCIWAHARDESSWLGGIWAERVFGRMPGFHWISRTARTGISASGGESSTTSRRKRHWGRLVSTSG